MTTCGSSVVKFKNGIQLIARWELKYFKNGRANMHVARSYEVVSADHVGVCRWNITTKAEALKYFKELTKE